MFVAVPDEMIFPFGAAGRGLLQILDSDGEIEMCFCYPEWKKNNWEKDEHLII